MHSGQQSWLQVLLPFPTPYNHRYPYPHHILIPIGKAGWRGWKAAGYCFYGHCAGLRTSVTLNTTKVMGMPFKIILRSTTQVRRPIRTHPFTPTKP